MAHRCLSFSSNERVGAVNEDVDCNFVDLVSMTAPPCVNRPNTRKDLVRVHFVRMCAVPFSADRPRIVTALGSETILILTAMITKCTNYRRCGRQAKATLYKILYTVCQSQYNLQRQSIVWNPTGKGSVGNTEIIRGNPRNTVKFQTKGSLTNEGNTKKSRVKTRADEHNVARRSGENALVMKKR